MYRKYHQRPTFRQMQLENVSVALEFLDHESIKLVSIGECSGPGPGTGRGTVLSRRVRLAKGGGSPQRAPPRPAAWVECGHGGWGESSVGMGASGLRCLPWAGTWLDCSPPCARGSAPQSWLWGEGQDRGLSEGKVEM
jgi:hypothetical protein